MASFIYLLDCDLCQAKWIHDIMYFYFYFYLLCTCTTDDVFVEQCRYRGVASYGTGVVGVHVCTNVETLDFT